MSESADYWCQRRLTITVQGPHGRSIHALDRPWARVGSHPSAEILLPAADAAPCGIYFHATNTGIYCAGLAPAAPIAREERSTPPLRLGRYTVLAALEGDAPAAPAADRPAAPPTLLIVETAVAGKPSTTRQHPLRAEFTLVGSQPPATLRVEGAGLAAAQCVLFVEQGRLWVIDLFSGQDTRLDGCPIDARLLRAGGVLELGDLRLRAVATAGEGGRAQDDWVATAAASADADRPAAVDTDAMVRGLTARLSKREQDRRWAQLPKTVAQALIVLLITALCAAAYVWFVRH